MTTTRRIGLAALVAWTVFIWGTRLSNAWRSTTESTAAKLSSTVIAVVFLGFAAATVWILVRTRSRAPEIGMANVLQGFAVWTVSVWVVRIVMIVLAVHSVPFKVVHLGLALVSVVLAVPAWRVGRDARVRWSAESVAG